MILKRLIVIWLATFFISLNYCEIPSVHCRAFCCLCPRMHSTFSSALRLSAATKPTVSIYTLLN